jgi:hypothetical protein
VRGATGYSGECAFAGYGCARYKSGSLGIVAPKQRASAAILTEHKELYMY